MLPNRTFGRIGRYTLLGTLAEGGMARVFLAQRDDADEMCVLKQLHLELEEHATASIRFQREAVIASKLSHPSIAKVLDSGFQGSRFYIAMEFIAGQTVEDITASLREEKCPIPPSIAIAIIAGVLGGLDHAHAIVEGDGEHMGLVHRDLTPRNIMVAYEGGVKIIDFGLARANIEDDDFRTGPGVLLGTLSYMAPEQALTLDVDSRSDLYSVGVILYELLTERPLLAPASASETIRSIVRDRPPRLKSLKPGLPDALEWVLERALAKSPEERFQTAREFRAALTACWEELPSDEELGAFVRGLFSKEERETRWLLRAAQSLRADHRNFFEDTIEDRFDRVVSEAHSRPDSVWLLDKTEPDLRTSDDLSETEEVAIRIPLERFDTETEPGTAPLAPMPVVTAYAWYQDAIKKLGRSDELTFSLDQMPLEETLMLLHECHFTGCLDLGASPEIDRIYFRTGAVAGVSSNRRLDAQLLGNALIDLKAVSPGAIESIPRGLKDLDAALLGRYLIQRGLIDEPGLERAHAEQARRRLYHLFERRNAPVRIRQGIDQSQRFFPIVVDLRPIVAYGMVVSADLDRKSRVVERLRHRRVRLREPYDEERNVYGLPPPVVEAIRALDDGVVLGPMPMLPGLDPMTTAGVLLLFDRASLLTVDSEPS